MHRSHLLRLLALTVCLFSVQCLDSLSDDCAKTLTCPGPAPGAELDANCIWKFSDGRVWEEGPKKNAQGRWVWPDGKETETQDFRCGATDAGATDGDAGGPDCRTVGCDGTQICNPATRRCVECLSSVDCTNAVASGDAGTGAVCDLQKHSCVTCLTDVDCTGTNKVCKSDSNECVQCTRDAQCGGNTPVCDLGTNECSTRCTDATQCAGGNKPVCNIDRQLCVECLVNAECSGATSQCNPSSNECVQCVDDVPCLGSGQVCDTTANRCVSCRDDSQCAGTTPLCDPESKTCVSCLNDLACLNVSASRCNTATHVCVGCNADAQCEGGAVCRVADGQCVQCTNDFNCSGSLTAPRCEPVSGTCVECADSSQCLQPNAAHCEVAVNAAAGTRFTCVGCRDPGMGASPNIDCGAKPGVPPLCRTDGLCVDCTANSECPATDITSRCTPAGVCGRCSADADCSLVTGKNACLGLGGNARCVECVDNGDCTGNIDGPICKTTNGGNPSLGVNTCVQCVADSDCTNPSASNCVNNQCIPCVTDADCSGIVGAPNNTPFVCDTSANPNRCEQCTSTNFARCTTGGVPYVCDSRGANPVCSTTVSPNTASGCEACIADAQCGSAQLCVAQTFGAGNTAVGFFCFDRGTDCPATGRPFVSVKPAVSIDDVSATVCGLALTTCPGLVDHRNATACSADTECGAAGLADGFCVNDICKIPCVGSGADCPVSCGAGQPVVCD
jgi:Cys-rich repeat protein